MWARLSMKTKLTIIVVTIVAFVTSAFARLMYNGLTDMLDNILGLRAETVSHTIVQLLDRELINTMDVSSLDHDEYKIFADRITSVAKRGYVDRVEVVRFVEDSQAEVLINYPRDNSPDYLAPGTKEKIQPGSLFSQRTPGHHPMSVSSNIVMAGWTPVRSGHRVTGLVVVYISMDQTNMALETASLAILITMIAFTVLSGLTAFKFAAAFEKTAVTDGLMGIYNHKYFKQRLEEEVAKARRYSQQTSLVLLDIDYFKRVNDTYGHATGDIVLKNLAKWVTEATRTTDVVARYGGEEIAVILPHTGVAGAQEFAERLRQKIASQVVHDPEENAKFRVTISVGVAQWEQGLTPIELIKRADAALYHSKNSGRNRVSLYQDELLPAPDPPAKTGA